MSAVVRSLRSAAKRTWQMLRFGPAGRKGIPPVLAEGVDLRSPADFDPRARDAWAVFFGYFDKTPWSPDGRRMLLHRAADARSPRVAIQIVDLEEERWLPPLAESAAWNLQQGCMTQWLPGSEGRSVIFNDVDGEDRLVARILSVDGEELLRSPWPIQVVHPGGRQAICLNYRRLARLRPDYGYDVDVRNFSPDMPPDRDGLWRVDLSSGNAEPIVTLAELADRAAPARVDPARSKVNHALYSPSGRRFVFMHRWFHPEGKSSRLYRMDSDGTGLRLVLEEDFISHYSWIDDRRLVLYAGMPGEGPCYFVLDTENGDCRRIGREGLDAYRDGHPSPAPDGRRIVTDTYPDRECRQRLLIGGIDGGEPRVAATLFHPPQYRGPRRCDLHPRWSPDGRSVSIDSVWSGRRRSYILSGGPIGS